MDINNCKFKKSSGLLVVGDIHHAIAQRLQPAV
jgi:hypothetical protein